MIAYAAICPAPAAPYDGALSAAAVSLRMTLAEATAPRTSVKVDASRTLAQTLVSAVAEYARDGHRLPSPETVRRAFEFARALPADMPLPDVIIESDGEIGFDWDYDLRRVLSVSVGEGPMLRFATLIGAEPIHGRVPFAGALPHTLAFFLRRLHAV